jgi:hypothetical protein
MYAKPIETAYKGYRFRSRLEARWAVFFDVLGRRWSYEPQGYQLPTGWYLLDFELTIPGGDGATIFAEVKPQPLNERDIQLVKELVWGTGKDCLLLVGVPEHKVYDLVARCQRAPGDALSRAVGVLRRDLRCHGSPEFACPNCGDEQDVERAVSSARGARFEHGEQPIIKKVSQPSAPSPETASNSSARKLFLTCFLSRHANRLWPRLSRSGACTAPSTLCTGGRQHRRRWSA